MNSQEFILALIGLFVLSSFCIKAENVLALTAEKISAQLEEKNSGKDCALQMNAYYSNAGGIIENPIDCKQLNKKIAIPENKKMSIGSKSKIFVEVEAHYG